MNSFSLPGLGWVRPSSGHPQSPSFCHHSTDLVELNFSSLCPAQNVSSLRPSHALLHLQLSKAWHRLGAPQIADKQMNKQVKEMEAQRMKSFSRVTQLVSRTPSQVCGSPKMVSSDTGGGSFWLSTLFFSFYGASASPSFKGGGGITAREF